MIEQWGFPELMRTYLATSVPPRRPPWRGTSPDRESVGAGWFVPIQSTTQTGLSYRNTGCVENPGARAIRQSVSNLNLSLLE